MENNFIKQELISEGVVLVTISRPDALNALNKSVLRELKEVITALRENQSLTALLLTGDGSKSFVAGADIAEMRTLSRSDAITFARLGQDVTKLIEFFPAPTIALVNGFALGGGMELALSCDWIIAAEEAVFGQPEVGLGVIPGFGATVRLMKYVGLPMAKELILTGRKIKADEALRLGLVNRVVPREALRAEGLAVANLIGKQSPSAVRLAKELLNEFSESIGVQSKLDSEAQEFGSLFGSQGQTEGMAAFVEKRSAKFINRGTA